MAEKTTDAPVSPPAGTGNAPGLGEAFTLDLNTGQGGYTVALPMPDGVAGLRPDLKLRYSHGSGVSAFGLGWSMPVRTIERRLDFGVPGDDVVERVHDAGSELVEVAPGEYRALVESAYARYTRQGDGWVVDERTGLRSELGLTSAARVADPDHPERVVSWLLERTVDVSGNEIHYEWEVAEGTPYLSSIRWAIYTVRVEYENRPDVHRNGRAGFLRLLRRRATRLELHVDEPSGTRRTRTWTLGYEQAPGTGVSLLASVQLTSHGTAALGPDVVRRPQRFGYTSLDLTAAHARFLEPEDAPPPPLTDAQTVVVALDDVPLPGVLSAAGGEHMYWPGTPTGWGMPRPVHTPHASALAGSGTALLDIDGNATVDLLVATGPRTLQGYYENGGPQGFTRFVAYPRDARALPPLADPRTRLADLDGDGRVDALYGGARAFASYRNTGASGWHEPTAAPRGDGENGPDVDLGDPTVRLADMTGDGLPDLVRVRSGRVEYWPNLGHGRFGAVVVMTGSPRLRASADPSSLALVDVDGDGCADLVRVDSEGVTVWLNRSGNGWSLPHADPLVPTPIPGTLRSADVLGRGAATMLWNSPRSGIDAYVAYELAPGPPAYLLETVDNGAGLESRISYRSAVQDAQRDRDAGQPWTTYLPFPVTVVAGTREHDTVTNRVAACAYRYSDGHYDPVTRQFQGFGRVEKQESGDASRPDSLTVLRFLVGQDRRPGNTRRHAALNRLQHRSEVYSLDGSPAEPLPMLVEESEHALDVLDVLPDGRERVRIAVRRSRRRWSERTVDERVEEHTYAYDADGNVIEDVWRAFGTAAGAPVPEVLVRTSIEYAVNRARNLIDKPSRVVKRDGAGTLLAEVRRHYDGAAFVGLALGSADRGLMTRELEWVGPRGDLQAHYNGMDLAALGYTVAVDADGRESLFAARARREFDAAGREVATLTPLGVATTFGYDPSGLFRVRETGPLGTTEREVDRATGQVTRTRAPDGVETTMRYDAQGRLVSLVLPRDTDALPTRLYVYDDSVVPHSVRVSYRLEPGQPGMLETAVYFDGLSKEIQRRVRMRPGSVVVSGAVVPNPWGDPAAEHEPSLAADLSFAPAPTTGPARRFGYDAQGRPLRTVDYTGGVSTVVYRPFEMTSLDGTGNTRTDRVDAANRRIAVTEGALTTRYAVGVLGELSSVTDEHGVASSYTYDAAGNRLTVASREAGTRRLFYDAARRVVRTVDARGVDISATFDDAERMTAVRADGTVLETYTYDDLATNGLGRLREVRYPGGAQRFTYDRRGEIATQEWEVDGHASTYRIGFARNGLGRVTGVTYPDGSLLRYDYADNGMVVAVPGIVDEIEYDARMLPVRVRHANGVVTSYTYTAGPGRVAQQRSVAPDGTLLEDARYSYDALARLLQVTDVTAGTPTVTDYSYDSLGQLVNTQETSGGGAPPDVTTYGYAGRDLRDLGETDSVLAYTDAAHPRRPTSLTVGGGAPEALSYDANGNLVALPDRTLSFDAKSQLIRAVRGPVTADYGYDHTGMRVRKRVTDLSGATAVVSDTVFLGRWAEVRGGVLARYAVLGTVRVALLRGTTTTWIHTDQLGSATYFTDASGAALARMRYTPFGNRRSASGTQPHVVFALHEWDDEAGLFFMRRRYYAPELGRFVTPDGLYLLRPEQGVDDPRSLSLYTYVGNDPLNNVDPTGTSFWSVVGAIVGVVVGVVAAVLIAAAFASGIGFGLLAIAGLIGVVVAGYALASANRNNGFGEFMRGFLIGMNAGLNAAFLAMLGPVGLGIGIAVGILIFLGSFDSIASSDVYQGFLGWGNWLMPMSWLIVGLGLVFFVLNVLGWAVTFGQVDALKIEKVFVDWKTGTIFMKGGWISNLNAYKTAFNMGNFAFIHKDSPDDHVEHEAGHTLNLAAFGSAFHLVGFVDEVILGNGARAYSERLADSNEPAGSRPATALPMWS